MQESQALMAGGQDYASEDETFSLTRCPGPEPFMTGIACGKTWNSSRPPLGSLGAVRDRYGKLSIHLQGLPSPARRLHMFPTCHTSRPPAATVAECWPDTSKVLVYLWGRCPVSCLLWKVAQDWRCWVCTTCPLSIARCISDRLVVKWGQCEGAALAHSTQDSPIIWQWLNTGSAALITLNYKTPEFCATWAGSAVRWLIWRSIPTTWTVRTAWSAADLGNPTLASIQNVRWLPGMVDMPTVHCTTIFFFFHPFSHLPHFLVLFPRLLSSLVSLFSPFTLPTSVVFSFISPLHWWLLQVPTGWYPSVPHNTTHSSSSAFQGPNYPDPTTSYHCKCQVNIIILSQNTTSSFIINL